MKPDPDLAELLRKKGIEFLAFPSKKAAGEYNRLSREKKAGACFHLTC
jgi:hypothetical protein